jgi:hypothetical protein
VSTTPRRGAVEHHYRATMRPFFSAQDWSTLPASTRRAVVDGTLGEVFKDISEAASSGGFDDDLVHVSRSPMALDAEGFQQLAELLESTVEQAARIQAASAERGRGAEAGEASGVELVLMGFRTAPR